MSIIAFPLGGRSTAPPEAVCDCGNVWFEIVRRGKDGIEMPGAVTMSADGNVWGYAGVMRCVECGNDYKP